MTLAQVRVTWVTMVVAFLGLFLLSPRVSADTVDVDITNFAFVPSSVTIAVGDAVRWTNNDAQPHTSTSTTGLWDSGTLTTGQTFIFTFTTQGSFDYFCEIHPFMTGTVEVTAVTDAEDEAGTGLPDEFEVEQNYPNPFNPTTTISYSLPTRAYVSLAVYNIAGQKVATLVDGEQPAGEHAAQWNATNDNGEELPSGIYLYRLDAGEFSETRKMVLLR